MLLQSGCPDRFVSLSLPLHFLIDLAFFFNPHLVDPLAYRLLETVVRVDLAAITPHSLFFLRLELDGLFGVRRLDLNNDEFPV